MAKKTKKNPPLFHAMTETELWAFWKRYQYPSQADAAELIGDRRKGYTRLAKDLANYACNKAVAMKERLKGNIESALIYERIVDNIYDRLPEDLQW